MSTNQPTAPTPAPAAKAAGQLTPTSPPADPTPAQAGAEEGTDWKAESRKWETRAKENKAKADQFDQLQESQKTEAQRQADALQQAQREAADAKSALLRYEVGAAKGVPANLIGRLQGATREELEADADALLAAFPAGGATPTPTRPVTALSSGATSADSQQPADNNESLRRLFKARR